MLRKRQTRGPCGYCKKEMTRGGLSKHLHTCVKRQEEIIAANQKSERNELIYHLQVQDAWQGDFWLHLEMKGSATLKELDNYLREIWLECCGHMSRFSVGGWSGNEISMNMKASRVFGPGVELTHIYDFGTSSETLIKVVAVREGKPTTPHPLALMARNDLPETTCIECEQPASWLCIECLYNYDESGTLCDKHAKRHPHDDYGNLLPLVNSPRLGMCGYDGPAEPPY